MKNSHRKTLLAVSMLAVTGTAAWASCGGTEALVVNAATSLSASVAAKLASAASDLVSRDKDQTDALLSAIKVVTKQVSVSADKVAATTLGSEQAMTSVAKEIADKELIDKAVVDYMSQGFDPCGLSASTQNMAKTEAQVTASVPVRIRSEIDAVGGKFGSVADAVRAREERHRALFCTQAEVDSGACSSVGKLPGGDMNAALLFGTDTSREAVAAKNALINQVIGLPDAAPSKEAANTPEGAAYLLEKKKKDAFLAWPAYSLKSIQAENEGLKAVMDDRVGQYFGTPRADDWAKSQASQAPRGLLVDMVKIQGLNLKIAERRLKQNMRIEANLAAMLELDNQMRGRQAEDAVVSDEARRKVK